MSPFPGSGILGLKVTPYHCNHKSFDLPFSWDKRETITDIFPPIDGFTLISTTNYSWLRLHLPGKLTFIATQLEIKSISQLPSHRVISLETVNKTVSAIFLVVQRHSNTHHNGPYLCGNFYNRDMSPINIHIG